MGVLRARQMNPTFRCSPMCWLITMKCSSTMEFSLPKVVFYFEYMCASFIKLRTPVQSRVL